MPSLTEKIAEVLYSADAQPVRWAQAQEVDRRYYLAVSDVVVDTVVDHLRFGMEIPTDAICEFLQTETDIHRLRRETTIEST